MYVPAVASAGAVATAAEVEWEVDGGDLEEGKHSAGEEERSVNKMRGYTGEMKGVAGKR